MPDIWLVRHGPTHQKNFVGWRDVPADLSDTAALARLDAYLPSGAVVVASDLIRASATAAAIQGSRTRLPDNPGLREMNFGAWDGLHHTEVSARDPILSRQFWDEPGDLRAPGGESWNDASGRFSVALDAIIAGTDATDIIVVCHMGVILTQVQRASGSTAYAALGHSIDNLSVTQIRKAGGWSVGAINHRP